MVWTGFEPLLLELLHHCLLFHHHNCHLSHFQLFVPLSHGSVRTQALQGGQTQPLKTEISGKRRKKMHFCCFFSLREGICWNLAATEEQQLCLCHTETLHNHLFDSGQSCMHKASTALDSDQWIAIVHCPIYSSRSAGFPHALKHPHFLKDFRNYHQTGRWYIPGPEPACPCSQELSTRVCREGRGSRILPLHLPEPELEMKQELSPDTMKKQTGNQKKGFSSSEERKLLVRGKGTTR